MDLDRDLDVIVMLDRARDQAGICDPASGTTEVEDIANGYRRIYLGSGMESRKSN